MADTPKSYLDRLTTLTGESLVAALNALDEKLPDGAYKQVSFGSRKFTDISPAYSTEEISNHFGPLGIGWGYSVEEEMTEKVGDTLSVTIRALMWFLYLIDGKEQVRVEWQTYGGNANGAAKADRHFCWQGALTNAIGKGWSLQGFQRTIYKGEDFQIDDAPNNPLKAEFDSMIADTEKHDTKHAVWNALGKPKDRDAMLAAYIKVSDVERAKVRKLADGTLAA